MEDARLKPTSGRKRPRAAALTPRIILWTLAGAMGLWLGMGSRTVAAGGKTTAPAAAAQTAIADVFSFDILLAGKQPTVHPKAPPAKSPMRLPEVVLVALQQRPEPVQSAMPQTLTCVRTRLAMSPPARPGRRWNMELNANLARLEHAHASLVSLLATVPGLSPADRRSIEKQAEKAGEQIGSLEKADAMRAQLPPELQTEMPEAWPEHGRQLMP